MKNGTGVKIAAAITTVATTATPGRHPFVAILGVVSRVAIWVAFVCFCS